MYVRFLKKDCEVCVYFFLPTDFGLSLVEAQEETVSVGSVEQVLPFGD